MAKTLEIQVTVLVPRPKDKILGRLYSNSLGAIASPMLEGILGLSNKEGAGKESYGDWPKQAQSQCVPSQKTTH